jgi:enoyl-CoA hydratase/carnithine racemase
VNALDDDLVDQIDATLDGVQAEPAIALLRIRSDQKTFSAGADLKLIEQRLGSEAGILAMTATLRRLHRVFDRLAAFPAVTIAEIEGAALGGGLELALACDLRIAVAEAKIGLPETGVGLLPGAGGTQRLTRLCGAGVANRIILGGGVIDGHEAARLGIVQWSFPRAEFAEQAAAVVQRVSACSPAALRAAKACIAVAHQPDRRGVEAEITGIGHLMTVPDTQARIAAFVAR